MFINFVLKFHFKIFVSSWITTEAFYAMWKRFKEELDHVRKAKIDSDLVYESSEWVEATKGIPWIALWMDGHSAHFNLRFLKGTGTLLSSHLADFFHIFCLEAQVQKVLVMPFIAHTSHLCQPLDTGINTAIHVCADRCVF
jgi:hypothetical protein